MRGEPNGPPGRFVLRLAGMLTQLACAASLLVGTIAFVLVQQNQSGGGALAVAWAGVALLGIVFGGLMTRGGMLSVLTSVVITGAFAVGLLVLDYAVLRGLVQVLPESDVAMIAEILVGAGIGLGAITVITLAAIPQAIRYGRWLHTPDAARSGHTQAFQAVAVAETARGWNAPAPAPGYVPPPARLGAPSSDTSMWHVPAAPPAEQRSRRRMYFALAGFAIGVGAGTGVLVSSKQQQRVRDRGAPVAAAMAPGADQPGLPEAAGAPATLPETTASTAPIAQASAALPVPATPTAPSVPLATFVDAQVAALTSGNPDAIIATLAPQVFGFGIDGTAVVEGALAAGAQLGRDLGEAPAIEVGYRGASASDAGDSGWITLELAVTSGGRTRKLAVTELVQFAAGSWSIAAWCWAELIPDATAERMAILGTLPAVTPVAAAPDAAPPELVAAVREAFADKVALVSRRSAHPLAVNVGSGPAQRTVGGERIRARPTKGRWRFQPRGSMRIVSTSATAGYSALVLDFTTPTSAGTEVTQPLRMLALWQLEGPDWRIVSAQWSNGGPIR